MRTVRKNTILIAEDIPEKDYGYRPAPESRSVAETLVHIASLSLADRFLHEEEHLSSLESFDFGALIQKSEIEEKRPRSKDQNRRFTAHGRRTVVSVGGEPSRAATGRTSTHAGRRFEKPFRNAARDERA